MRKLSSSEIPRASFDAVDDLSRHPIVVIVHNVRSIYNVGSIFRTADAARVEHLYLTGYTGTPEHKNLHKTALGAQDTVPWSEHDAAMPVVERLRKDGYTIAALEITDAPTRPSEVDPAAFPLALIVGNEVDGVDDALIDASDLAVEIPQYGAKLSLNVSVAFGVAALGLVERYRATHDRSDDPSSDRGSAPSGGRSTEPTPGGGRTTS